MLQCFKIWSLYVYADFEENEIDFYNVLKFNYWIQGTAHEIQTSNGDNKKQENLVEPFWSKKSWDLSWRMSIKTEK